MPEKTCPTCDRRFDVRTHFCPIDGTPLTLGAGTLLHGRYEIVRELGHGAMGVVYLAKEKELGDRACAIKVLRVPLGTSESAMAEALRRLRSEAQVLGQLGSHPNLVTVYTAGQDENGLAYVAMEYVEGETLQVKFDEGTPFTAPQVARIVRQIANGLSHAHERNIVHRDLKPGNLIFTRSPQSDGWVKIVDFGIAKALNTESATDMTEPNRIIGTAGYMSPEQSAALPLDNRSDLFTLAMIAIELLLDDRLNVRGIGAGREGVDALAESAGWPENLKEVLARGIALDPIDRYPSALAFADAFEAALEQAFGGPVPALPPPPTRVPTHAPTHVVTPGVPRRFALPMVIVSLTGLAIAFGVRGLGRDGGAAAVSDSVALPMDSTEVAVPPAVRDTATGVVNEPPDAPDTASPPVVAPDYGPDVAALREQVDLETSDATQLNLAVAVATGLLDAPDLADTLAVEVRYLRAEAALILGHDGAACADLRSIEDQGGSSQWTADRFGRAVGALLELHCGPP